MSTHSVWLDCDPGHDDAIAILLALHLPEIHLLGISVVHGNASIENTTLNAARCLLSYGSAEQSRKVKVYAGVTKPLLRPVRHDSEIHGNDGLGGVQGLLAADDPRVRAKVEETKGQKAVEAIAATARALPEGQQLSLVATGALTNIALFVSLYPELVREKISQIVLMGGAEGRGNRSPTAEFNILIDPEAAAIVFDAEVKVVIAPLNVTHQALFCAEDNDRLMKIHTPLRYSLSTLLNFFAKTYAEVFDFVDGPPVHDPLCIAYIARPELFKGKRYRVDVELEGKYTAGTTSVDLYDYRTPELTSWRADPNNRESWGALGKNVFVLEQLDVPAFWLLFQECVDRSDKVSLLNDSQ
ncbi:nucleoside hydrolase [Sporobolomyces salmoneus]|uniref:nucleoside hydrolase n=1 Tax=Sporobolomyces salmoneus TaxID=183962 RepID=UPI0031809065